MRHLLFKIERKEPKSQNMYSVPIFYTGRTPVDAFLSFMHDHDVKEMAAFIEPILWVWNDHDSYRTELFLQGNRKRFTFNVERSRRERGEYLPGEEDRDHYGARVVLANTVAQHMKDVLTKLMVEMNET